MTSCLHITLALIAMGGPVATAQAADSSAQPPAAENTEVRGEGTEKAAQESPPPKAETEPDHAHESPLLFPGGIRIGGLFDASYERVDMNGSLSSGQNAFRNYHHFVFISRQGD